MIIGGVWRYSPVGVMHTDSLLPVQYSGLVTHHTRLVQGGLTVQNEDIAVPEMSVDLLVDSWS